MTTFVPVSMRRHRHFYSGMMVRPVSLDSSRGTADLGLGVYRRKVKHRWSVHMVRKRTGVVAASGAMRSVSKSCKTIRQTSGSLVQQVSQDLEAAVLDWNSIQYHRCL